MPIEKFPLMNNTDETLRVWKRKLEYLFQNLDGTNFSSTGGSVLGIAAVKDYHIDWGVGAQQVSAADMPITDINNFYTGATVETALNELGYTLTITSTDITLSSSHKGWIICNSTGNLTVTLPTAVGSTKTWYNIKNSNVGVVTINPPGAETLDDSTSFDLYQYESLALISDGSNWKEGG